MVFFRDDGSVFEAPLDLVWEFVGSKDGHSTAHAHRKVDRRSRPGNSGDYSWEQDFDGTPTVLTMRWTSFHPLGVAYRVLAGPFEGSQFFLVYTPLGDRTGVSVIGEFLSPTIPEAEIAAAVDRFFTKEFDQDHAAIRALARQRR